MAAAACGMAAAAGAAAAAWLAAAGAAGAAAQEPPGFAGAEACRGCHADQYGAWAGSTHGAAGGPPGPGTVIAPFGQGAIEFADGRVLPVVEADGRYAFVVEREGRPPLRFEVSGVVGRGHMEGGGTQGFMSRFPDGTERFLPFDYSEETGAWFCNTAFVGGFWVPGADRARLRADAGWLPIGPDTRLTDCGDWPPVRVLGAIRRFANCQNCHGSRVEVDYRPEEGRYETSYATLRIDCESCHGPAAAHVEWAARPDGPDPRMAALDTLSTDASLGVCLQCHALKRALVGAGDGGAGGAGGADGGPQYSLGLPLVGDSPYLPDGRIATFGYQQTHRSSACYLFGSMTCVDCHAPHSQDYRDVFGNPLRGRFDDGQCTACHAAVAADPERHSFHPAGSPGAACVSCHMPYVQHPELADAIPYGRADHTISIPRPGADEAMGIGSACAGCHRDMTTAELAARTREWWGELRPHRPEVRALVAATAPGADGEVRARALAEAAALGPRHGLAKVMAVDAWVRGGLRGGDGGGGGGEPGPEVAAGLDDGPGRALAALAADADIDARAAAAAALHALRGDRAEVRALLNRLPRAEADPAGLRSRWAGALSQWAAAAERDAAGPEGAEAGLRLLRRAREAQPDAPERLVALGAGLAAAGEVEEAVQVYLEALRRRPEDPVALVNLGLGLESLGRADEAEAVYERAALVRPTEALAHFNLGNARLRRGEFAAAAEAYRAAVLHDPGLARAHFYLGVSLVNAGRAREALVPLRDALEFAPGDAEIADVLRRVRAMLGLEPR